MVETKATKSKTKKVRKIADNILQTILAALPLLAVLGIGPKKPS